MTHQRREQESEKGLQEIEEPCVASAPNIPHVKAQTAFKKGLRENVIKQGLETYILSKPSFMESIDIQDKHNIKNMSQSDPYRLQMDQNLPD